MHNTPRSLSTTLLIFLWRKKNAWAEKINDILAHSSRFSLSKENEIAFEESESLEEDVHFVVVLAGGGGWKIAGN